MLEDAESETEADLCCVADHVGDSELEDDCVCVGSTERLCVCDAVFDVDVDRDCSRVGEAVELLLVERLTEVDAVMVVDREVEPLSDHE